MKKLVLTALVFGTGLLATGCEVTTFSPSWQLQDWNDQTETVVAGSCRTDSNTMKFYALPSGDTNPDNAITDLFNCTDGGGTTADLPAGSYTTWVELTSDDNAVLYAQSGSVQASVAVGGDEPVNFAFQVNRGYYHGSWTLDASKGTTCTKSTTQGTVAGVAFDATGQIANNDPVPDEFDCAAGQGTTYPILIDNYTVSVSLIDSAGAGLGTPGRYDGVNVQWGNQTFEAGSTVLSY